MTSRRSIVAGLVLGAFLSCVCLSTVNAQVPRSISYQGQLMKSGQPVNGSVDLHVKIYNAAGTMLYEESYTAVQVTSGIFNVLLGGNSGTLPLGLKFDEQYYLGIDVNSTGEVSPRTPFVAAPYALNAQTVGGVGVSVTPQAGMLLPLDATGKIPKAALPQQTTALTSIDKMQGDANGNVQLVAGPGISIVDNNVNNTITIGVSGGGATPDTITVGPGLTGGGIGTRFNLGIAANNWITNNMLGTGVVTGMKLDQNVPALGLYQNTLGNLNVGIDATLTYVVVPQNPVGTHGVGLNLSNPNVWLALQTFNAGITVNGTTTLNGTTNQTGPLNVTGTETITGNLVVTGTAEPSAAANGAALYEIQDNGDLRVTGSTTIAGNTFIGNGGIAGNTNQIGVSGVSANTMTGLSNSIQSATNTIGTANASSSNTIGAAGSSTNTMTGATNNVTGGTNNLTGTTNNVNATTNNMGTVSGQTNNIGTGGLSTNTIGVAGSGTNSIQGATTNIGTNGGNNTVGLSGSSTNNINGLTNTMTATSSNNMQSPANNIGTTNASSVNTIGNAGSSTNTTQGLTNNSQANTVNIATTVTGATTNIGNVSGGVTTTNFNGNVIHQVGGSLISEPNAATAGAVTNYELRNLGDFQNSGATNLIGNVFMNQNLTVAGLTTLNGGLTIIGPLTQSGGNAQIAGAGTNSFGTFGGANNTIGSAGATNTITGATNNMTATTGNNINGVTTVTGNTTVTGGTFTTTGNSFIGTASTNNTIGTAGTSINTVTGATNNFTASTANNFTGDIIQISGRVSIAPTASTTNNFGTGASQTNNFGIGASTANNLGTGNGDVNNIGTVSGGGISTNNIGNLNAGTNNNINGLSTFQYTGDQTYVRIAGGAASCGGAFPTSAQSELLVNGDGWFDGTVAACRLNVFGVNPSCIQNLSTSVFTACITPTIQLGSNMTALNATITITGMNNVQAVTLTTGTPGTNATNINSSNAGPGTITVQTPSVPGRMPQYQTYSANLVPASGPNGGGAFTFNAATTGGLLNFDANDAIMVSYRSHNLGIPAGALYVTTIAGVSITVESSAANDNNVVQIQVLRD